MLIAYAIAMRDLQKKFQGKPVYEIGRDEFFALEDKVFEDRLLVILEDHIVIEKGKIVARSNKERTYFDGVVIIDWDIFYKTKYNEWKKRPKEEKNLLFETVKRKPRPRKTKPDVLLEQLVEKEIILE